MAPSCQMNTTFFKFNGRHYIPQEIAVHIVIVAHITHTSLSNLTLLVQESNALIVGGGGIRDFGDSGWGADTLQCLIVISFWWNVYQSFLCDTIYFISHVSVCVLPYLDLKQSRSLLFLAVLSP